MNIGTFIPKRQSTIITTLSNYLLMAYQVPPSVNVTVRLLMMQLLHVTNCLDMHHKLKLNLGGKCGPTTHGRNVARNFFFCWRIEGGGGGGGLM